MAVTQKQIAERLNVSRALVAKALNGADEVSAVMRQRVQEVAREMGYSAHSNQMARSLIARRYGQTVRTGIIALTSSSQHVTSPRNLPYFAAFLRGMEVEAAERGLDICLCLIRRGETPRLLQDHGVDGIVALTTLYPDMEVMRASGVPIVTYQTITESANSVGGDNREGGYLATRHLLELGHRNIAYLGVHLGDNGDRLVALRQQGYADALAEYGLPFRSEWVDCNLPLPNTSSRGICRTCGECAACRGWGVLKAKSGARENQRPPFTAVVCHNDPVAIGLVRQAGIDKLRVPRDLSVVGFDVSHEFDFHPEITSIGFPDLEMGRRALRMVQEIIESENPAEGQRVFRHEVFPAKLFMGESTAKPFDDLS